METTYFRAAEVELDDTDLDVERGRAKLSFSSELPVLRQNDSKYGTHLEVLSHAPGDANFGLLNSQGVVLLNHLAEVPIGDVVKGSARIHPDRKARATIRIDREYRGILRSIADGGAPNSVSVGYSRLSVVGREAGPDGVPILRFSWTPNEISILTPKHPPADASVGFGRSQSSIMKNSLDTLLTAALSGTRRNQPDFDEYSVIEALRNIDKPRGLVREISQTETHLGGDRISGLYMPFAVLEPRQRDMTVGVFGQGGSTVAGDLQPFISILRNKVVAPRLGARVVTGLRGNFIDPRQTSATTTQSLSETAAVTPSNPTFDQVGLVPKRVSVQIVLSKQLLLQTGTTMEDFLRQEISDQIGLTIDRLIINGAGGAGEPLGITNTPGVSSIVFGAAASWANIVAAESLLESANADTTSLGWAISPSTKGRWKQISRIAATNFPSFIFDRGFVNEAPALATNTLSGTHQCVFGDWKDSLILIWGDGLELIEDPYTSAATGQIKLTASIWFNLLIRHPQSFVVSADAANQ